MSGLFLLLATAGMLWLIISANKGISLIKNDLKRHRWRIWRIRWWNRYTRDFVVSIAIIYLGAMIFVGVTGMMIGLLTSFVVSVYLQLSAKKN